MPVYIGDVLESAGGPVLDLSTRQVKGIGFFSDTDQRDDLPEELRTLGYISVIDEKLEVYSPDSGDLTFWANANRWKSFLVNKGFALDIAYLENGSRNYQADSGFLMSTSPFLVNNQYPLKAGDVFHIRGIDKGYGVITPTSDRHAGAIVDGSYLCIQDVSIAPAPDGADGQIETVIEVIHDEIVGGAIVPFHPSRTSVSRHIALTNDNVSFYTAYDNLAEALLSNNNGKLLVGFDNYQTLAAQDFSLTFSDFISVLTTGIAEDLVTSGYGDYTSYGGVAASTYSAGDLNQDGLVTVADLILLLGGFGTTPDPTFNPAIVSFGDVYGDQGVFATPFNSSLYLFEQASTSRTFMYKDWGTYGENPTVSQGGATVHIVNSNNSLLDPTSIASPPGDMVIFAETPSNGFYINAFGGTQANQARIEIRENAEETQTDNFGWRNVITLTDEQQAANMQFKIVARIRRFSSAVSLPDITQNVIDDREILLHDLGSINDDVLYNLTSGSASLLTGSSISISDLYQNQTGSLIFQNVQDSEGNITNVRAVGVQLGFKFTNTFLGSNMNHPSVNISNFDLICYPPVG